LIHTLGVTVGVLHIDNRDFDKSKVKHNFRFFLKRKWQSQNGDKVSSITHSFTPSLPLSLSQTHTLSLPPSPPLTLIHTHTYTHTLSLSLLQKSTRFEKIKLCREAGVQIFLWCACVVVVVVVSMKTAFCHPWKIGGSFWECSNDSQLVIYASDSQSLLLGPLVVRESLYKSIFCDSRTTKLFYVVRALEKFGKHWSMRTTLS